MAKLTKEQRGWALYDWASSSYSMIITATILPLVFKSMATGAGVPGATSTAYLGYANSFANILLVISAPILGTLADFQGLKKKLFAFFVFLGVGFTALLAIVPPGQWMVLLIIYVVTAFTFSATHIFYDSFLIDVAEKKDMDKVSTYGFAIGYLGGVCPFIIAMSVVLTAQFGIIPISTDIAMRISFVIAAAWWGLFTIPMLRHVHQKYSIPRVKNPVSTSLKSLWETFKNIVQYKQVFFFLIAYFFYIDGVGTIIELATSYGSDLGISSTMLLIILLVTQFVAFPFAILYGKLASRFGTKKMILIAICVYIIVCIYALFLKTTLDFWILAMMVGTSQGGIQALSRSYFGKIIPKEKSNQFFGFYNIFGRFSAILGPILLGVTAQVTGQTRFGVFSIVVLFVVGGILFLKCKPVESFE